MYNVLKDSLTPLKGPVIFYKTCLYKSLSRTAMSKTINLWIFKSFSHPKITVTEVNVITNVIQYKGTENMLTNNNHLGKRVFKISIVYENIFP